MRKEEEQRQVVVAHGPTGKPVEVPVFRSSPAPALLRASDLQQLLNLRVYDPGFTNTASCSSAITFINGEKGILRYRGYPIEQLAEKASFLEVSFLLQFGQLPSDHQLERFTDNITAKSVVHDGLISIISAFPRTAHPMGIMISAMAALGTFHPEANPALRGAQVYKDEATRIAQVYRVMGSMPTIAAAVYRHCAGLPINQPPPSRLDLTYAESFMYMLNKLPVHGEEYRPNQKLARALDVLLTLHADHELNCSTATMRQLASSGVDVYSAISGSMGALYGPSHGGANEAVLKMLDRIGSKARIPAFLQSVKDKKAKLMGFGHRVYRNYDPRATLIRQIAHDVFDVMGKADPLIEVATALEQAALADEYFVSRKLYPNVDFYSGLIYKAIGFPAEFFTVLFALGRVSGKSW
eukprot:CAMPEP_0198314244 /NCGR_PEP_ID=MMETSP1450-20131203/4964_1 /TAXON_ID=753684 ORGANISM="Madagascaria erythrocladiodes, Strain CCMP3234" /NCGR_SAMPLE_ID=MMETSP1450 /ASSEMBLY_ACC=CAM_ASM_001115 /LENGTH=410 /DNA_ID=CAMNT_0044017285 /DNA_START=7 /DNA_END=1239 /DNA_ORIENTATION=+